jgi:hypothetical protein
MRTKLVETVGMVVAEMVGMVTVEMVVAEMVGMGMAEMVMVEMVTAVGSYVSPCLFGTVQRGHHSTVAATLSRSRERSNASYKKAVDGKVFVPKETYMFWTSSALHQ